MKMEKKDLHTGETSRQDVAFVLFDSGGMAYTTEYPSRNSGTNALSKRLCIVEWDANGIQLRSVYRNENTKNRMNEISDHYNLGFKIRSHYMVPGWDIEYQDDVITFHGEMMLLKR